MSYDCTEFVSTTGQGAAWFGAVVLMIRPAKALVEAIFQKAGYSAPWSSATEDQKTFSIGGLNMGVHYTLETVGIAFLFWGWFEALKPWGDAAYQVGYLGVHRDFILYAIVGMASMFYLSHAMIERGKASPDSRIKTWMIAEGHLFRIATLVAMLFFAMTSHCQIERYFVAIGVPLWMAGDVFALYLTRVGRSIDGVNWVAMVMTAAHIAGIILFVMCITKRAESASPYGIVDSVFQGP